MPTGLVAFVSLVRQNIVTESVWQKGDAPLMVARQQEKRGPGIGTWLSR